MDATLTDEPENLTLALLRKIDKKVDSLEARMESLGADLRSEMTSLAANVASDMLTLEKRLGDQIVGLRRAVVEYHSSAVGHGVLLNEFEERLRRLERHVGLPPESH